MKNQNESPTPEEVAQQLRKPAGELGKQVAQLMNEGNKVISLRAYQELQPQNKSHVLEIGMGNGYYVNELLKLADEISYVGVDYSSTMVEEANVLNSSLIQAGQVQFIEASIASLPFDDNSFDYITTANTLYFWPDPLANAKELLRVLKPDGKVLIAYRTKSFMDQLVFTEYGFTKYEVEEVEHLLAQAGFSAISSQTKEEPAAEFNGELLQVVGVYTMGMK